MPTRNAKKKGENAGRGREGAEPERNDIKQAQIWTETYRKEGRKRALFGGDVEFAKNTDIRKECCRSGSEGEEKKPRIR